MATSITTKFGIGDTVYFASTEARRKQHPCPDCLGAKKWGVKSPAGRSYEVSCPRCSDNFQSERRLSLSYNQFEPLVAKMHIGQVRACVGGDGKTQYMCVETGIGSGSIYDEHRLFATEAEALLASAALATSQNADVPWVVAQYDASLKFCDYQLSDARLKAKEDEAREIVTRYSYFIQDLENCETIEEVRSELLNITAKEAAQ